jgi:hypothetical protein
MLTAARQNLDAFLIAIHCFIHGARGIKQSQMRHTVRPMLDVSVGALRHAGHGLSLSA